MKRYFIIMVLFIILFMQTVFSQSLQTNEPDTLCGKKGLVFSFSGLNLGGGIGGKYWISSTNAIRFQVNGYYSKYSSENYSTNSLSILLAFENHFEFANHLSPYVGGSLGYTRRNQIVSYDHTADLGGLVGVEFWLNKSISLSGEQNISLSYSSNIDSHSTHLFKMRTSTSSLLLSIYF